VDVASYSGSIANYLLTHNSATGSYTLQDARSGSPEGTDLISGDTVKITAAFMDGPIG
jgi:hypothetical protein